MHRASRLSLLAFVLCSTVQAEFEIARWTSPWDYEYSVSHMPDFDQIRSGPNGLPFDGRCYCGPASAANIMGYIATHGFPMIPPHPDDYTRAGSYDRVTGFLDDLGEEMLIGADPDLSCGVTLWDVWWALDQELSMYFDVSFVSTDYAGSEWPSIDSVAQASIHDEAICAMLVGDYKWNESETGEAVLTERTGGHFMSMNYLRKDPVHGRYVTFRDPWTWDDEPGQSRFESIGYPIREKNVSSAQDDGSGIAAMLVNLYDRTSDPDDDFEWNYFIEGVVSVKPRRFYEWSTFDNAFIRRTTEGVLWSDSIAKDEQVDTGTHQIRDLGLDPDMLGILILDKEHRKITKWPVKGPDPIPLVLPEVDGRADLVATTRQRHLLVAAEEMLYRYSYDLPQGAQLKLDLPGSANAMHVDDRLDSVVLLHGALDRVSIIFDIHTDMPTVQMRELPAGDAWKDADRIVSLSNGEYYVRMSNGEVRRLLDTGSRFIDAPLDLGGHEFGGVDDIGWDASGRIYVASGGSLHVFKSTDASAGAWALDEAHPFTGESCGERFMLTRGRTNLRGGGVEPKLRDSGPMTGGVQTSDCRGDLNFDERVDGADLSMLLSAFGMSEGAGMASDLDRNGLVDGGDLSILLGAWGACP